MTRLAVLALAAYRLTRLVTEDTLLAGPRTRFLLAHPPDGHFQGTRWVGPSKLGQLVSCSYCAGVWVAAAAVTAACAAGRAAWSDWPWLVPAVAGAQALLSSVDAALASMSNTAEGVL